MMSSQTTPSKMAMMGGMSDLVVDESPIITLEQANERKRAGAPPWEYFTKRLKSHPQAYRGLAHDPVPTEAIGEALWAELAKPPRPGARVAYVHIPFCTSRCSFCGFYRNATGVHDFTRYESAILTHIESYRKTTWAQAPINTVYFGGGTPTAYPAESLVRILNALQEAFGFSEDCEISIESRIQGINADYLQSIHQAGANRISFGVQSFNTEIRRGVNRKASREEVQQMLNLAFCMGFANISIDLIYNLPGHTYDIWQQDITDALESPISGMSVYPLIYHANTPLASLLDNGKGPALGGIEYEYECFTHAHRSIQAASEWVHMSSVHSGKPSTERSRYNGLRSAPADVIALGSGSGGRFGSLRYMNTMDVNEYIEKVLIGQHPAQFAVRSHPLLEETYCVLNLPERLALHESTLFPISPYLHTFLDLLKDLELVVQKNGFWSLTENGRFWAYNIASLMSIGIGQEITRKGISNA